MCEKGRARQTKKGLPSLLRQTIFVCLVSEATPETNGFRGSARVLPTPKNPHRLQTQVPQSAGRLGHPGGHQNNRESK